MRKVFYPAVVGWILLAVWIATVRIRLRRVEERILDWEYEVAKHKPNKLLLKGPCLPMALI